MGFFAELVASMRHPKGLIANGSSASAPSADKSSNRDFLRPQGHALALEPRVMFDGAAATATADQQHHQGDATRSPEAPTAERSATASATGTEAAVDRKSVV